MSMQSKMKGAREMKLERSTLSSYVRAILICKGVIGQILLKKKNLLKTQTAGN